MSALDAIIDLDVSAAIAALPRMPGRTRIPPRPSQSWITLHYSGVAYRDRSPAVERQRIIDEAAYQLRKNWQTDPKLPPIYADCFMYDLVVLSDGAIARCRSADDPRQLWHCGNRLGNAVSWSIHVMLGGQQDLTQPQRIALFRVFDALRADDAIPRARVVGHCEWPRSSAAPALAGTTYRRQARQGPCPGPVIWRHLADYRQWSDHG